MNNQKLFFFKLFFLMILSLKMGYVVYQNISILSKTSQFSHVLDIEESEKNEKKELDEYEKIHQKQKKIYLNSFRDSSINNSIFSLNYNMLFLEFTTPPPEIIS